MSTAKNPSSKIDFATLKQSWQKHINEYLKLTGYKNTKAPVAQIEQGISSIEFKITSIDAALIHQVQTIAKKYLQNLRLHTFEDGFWSFQALNDNLYDGKGIIDNYKIRISTLSESIQVSFSKKGDFSHEELEASYAIFELFFPSKDEEKDPEPQLLEMGVSIYHPEAVKENAGQNLSFKDFAGYRSVKKQIQENIILPFLNPTIYDEITRLTRKYPTDNRPQSLLFSGDPGVGKTTMARIVAEEVKAPLVYVPIESIMSKYYGQSSIHLSNIFDLTALYKYSILFLDEIDALAGSRDQNLFEATRRVLSVLLRKMDGLDKKENILIIGATNRKQDLDAALISRFDLTIFFPLPNHEDRKQIISLYATHLKEDDLAKVSELSEGLSARNLKDLCEVAERKWVRLLLKHKKSVSPPPAKMYIECIKKIN